ncbi:MAG TPA: DUF6600 domain-containing protein [Bryobacteraceae bacterium]|nr:DUF6600 domain-containing protein [Bryobacteraceae bacterium]
MKRLSLLLVPAALLAGQARYARLGEFTGQVDVQLTAADPWIPAQRNLPLTELAWVRTGPGSRLEIELDDGGAWRLGPDSLGEISDYTQLSTSQRITLLSLDHGTAYYTGEPKGKDVLMLVVPGAQVAMTSGARVRATAVADWSQISVIEGNVRFSSPAADMGLREGQTARVEPATPSHFFLYPEVTALELDRWSEDRDKAEAAPASAGHVAARYGLADLDANGEWVQTDDLGLVWKPKVPDGWTPYRNGRWVYYDALGYTWVSDDPWGWLPYHNGRWARKDNTGWVWQPAVSTVFKPGEVYWMRGANLAGWGPLGPGEPWLPANPTANPPQFFASGNTTYAAFQPDVRTIDPAGFATPTAEQLKAAGFVLALPSPAFMVSRLDATRPVLKVGKTRVVPSVPGVTFSDSVLPPDPVMTNPDSASQPPTVVVDAPPVGTTPPDGVYPVPVLTVPVEVPVVLNPPDHPDYARRPGRTVGQTGTNNPGGQQDQGNQGGTPAGSSGTSTPPPSRPVSRGNVDQPVRERPAPPPPAAPRVPPKIEQPAAPLPKTEAPRVEAPRAEPPKVDPPKVEPPKVDPSKVDPSKKGGALSAANRGRPADDGESEIYRQVRTHVTTNLAQTLTDLDVWTRRYPNSDLAAERLYYYLFAYNGLSRPEMVLDTAARLLAKDVRASFQDQTKVLQIYFLTSANLQRLRTPTPQQLGAGRTAARQLLEFLPEYFSSSHKPAGVNDSSWESARRQLETIGKQVLAKPEVALRAEN